MRQILIVQVTEVSTTQHEGKLTMLVHSLKIRNKE